MPPSSSVLARAKTFCDNNNLRIPILLAPMAGACPPTLSVAVAEAGGLGACGAVSMSPEAIRQWASEVRAGTEGGFQINLWIPTPAPARNVTTEKIMRDYMRKWGPTVSEAAGEIKLADFSEQCMALLDIGPRIISSIMGLYPLAFVKKMKAQGIKWFATATTVSEAKKAEDAGADAIIAQGTEAGGHRGAFDASKAETEMVGLFSLLPAIVDAVTLPVIAAGGIADARGLAAALILGASAVQIGTAFLRCPEAELPSSWADAIGTSLPEQTMITRAFSGRAGRSLSTAYTRAMAAPDAPVPAPYPVQRGITRAMRDTAMQENDFDRIQAWAGQSSKLALAKPAKEILHQLWDGAQSFLL